MPPDRLNAASTPQEAFIPLHDRIQIALAIADQSMLRSLLTNCTPPILPPERLGQVSSQIGVPIDSANSADGVIKMEVIDCVPADTRDRVPPSDGSSGAPKNTADGRAGDRPLDPRRMDPRQPDYAKLTRCESKLRTLGQNLTQARAIALLSEIGLSPEQVETILALPTQAWHKSWWYTLDTDGTVKTPFLRLLRTRRYADGTFMLQYKDQFAQDEPPCFRGRFQDILIEIRPERASFKQTLEKINHARDQLGIQKVVLVCDLPSDLEARGFMSQGISLYTTEELTLPVQSDCAMCATPTCPMQGRLHSPVLTCRQFCLNADWVAEAE